MVFLITLTIISIVLYCIKGLMIEIPIIKNLLQRATAYSSRSTVLHPLFIILGILIFGTILSFYYEIPKWIGYTFASFCFVVILIFIIFYGYYSLRDFIIRKPSLKKYHEWSEFS